MSVDQVNAGFIDQLVRKRSLVRRNVITPVAAPMHGKYYHITWSLGPGREPVESNDVLRDRGWKHIETPIPLELEPAKF